MLQHQIMPTKIMEAVDNTADTPINVAKEEKVRNAEEIGAVAKAVRETLIWHTTVEFTEYALIQTNTVGPWQNSTIRTRGSA